MLRWESNVMSPERPGRKGGEILFDTWIDPALLPGEIETMHLAALRSV